MALQLGVKNTDICKDFTPYNIAKWPNLLRQWYLG